MRRRRHAGRKRRVGVLAALRTTAPVGAMFGDLDPLGFRQVKDLSLPMVRSLCPAHSRATPRTDARPMLDHVIGVLHLAEVPALVSLLPAGFPARLFPQVHRTGLCRRRRSTGACRCSNCPAPDAVSVLLPPAAAARLRSVALPAALATPQSARLSPRWLACQDRDRGSCPA